MSLRNLGSNSEVDFVFGLKIGPKFEDWFLKLWRGISLSGDCRDLMGK
jgi:hypothetical protein